MRARWFTEFFCEILDKTFAAGGGRGRGGVVVSALDFGSEGRWFDAQPLPSCCFLRQETLPCIVSLHPGV